MQRQVILAGVLLLGLLVILAACSTVVKPSPTTPANETNVAVSPSPVPVVPSPSLVPVIPSPVPIVPVVPLVVNENEQVQGTSTEIGIIKYIALPNQVSSGMLLSPPIVQIGNLRGGSTIDTWMQDGTAAFNGVTINYKRGDALSLFIVNGNRREMEYRVRYQDAPDEVNYSNTIGDGIGYSKAPPEAKRWVTFPSVALVPDGFAVAIPISIRIPNGVAMPKHWEFRIMVTMRASAMQELEAGTRFLLSTK